MVPLMALFLDIKIVVSIAVVFAVISGVILLLTFKTRQWIRKELLPTLIFGSIIGVVIGTCILVSYKSDIIKKAFGVFLVLYALKMLFWEGMKLRRPSKCLGILAGLFGGLLGALFGTGGPPIVIYLNSVVDDRRIFRSTILLYFLIANSWQLITRIYCGLITASVLMLCLYLLPAFVIGNIVGSLIHIKIDDKIFNKVIILVLLISGIKLIF